MQSYEPDEQQTGYNEERFAYSKTLSDTAANEVSYGYPTGESERLVGHRVIKSLCSHHFEYESPTTGHIAHPSNAREE